MQNLARIISRRIFDAKQCRSSEIFKKSKAAKVSSSSSWTHHFVCLAFCDQTVIPTTAYEKDLLISAGLGACVF